MHVWPWWIFYRLWHPLQDLRSTAKLNQSSALSLIGLPATPCPSVSLWPSQVLSCCFPNWKPEIDIYIYKKSLRKYWLYSQLQIIVCSSPFGLFKINWQIWSSTKVRLYITIHPPTRCMATDICCDTFQTYQLWYRFPSDSWFVKFVQWQRCDV